MKEFSLSSRAGPCDPTEPLWNAGISRAARIRRRERAGQGGGGGVWKEVVWVAEIQENERWSGERNEGQPRGLGASRSAASHAIATPLIPY